MRNSVCEMAAALANKASALERTGTLFRISFKFFRNSSTTSSTASPAAASSGAKKSKRKKKNLFEVVQFLPNWGIGYHMAKIHWTGVSYQITKINLYKVYAFFPFNKCKLICLSEWITVRCVFL